VILWNVTNRARPARLGRPQKLPPASASPLRSHTDYVQALAFSPDGRTLAAGSYLGMVILWDVTDPARPVRLGRPFGGGHPNAVVAFSPDGRTLGAGSSDNTVILWNVTNWARPARLGRPLADNSPVTSLAFTRDGRTLATGSTTVILWDVTDRARPARLGEPLSRFGVSSVALSPDGRTLAAGTFDAKVILSDLTDQTRPFPLGQPLTYGSSSVTSVAFSPDGRTLAAGGNPVILWDMAALNDLRGHTAQRACSMTGGGLNRSEWNHYISGLAYRDTCTN
jgi:WD40 repeat protein